MFGYVKRQVCRFKDLIQGINSLGRRFERCDVVGVEDNSDCYNHQWFCPHRIPAHQSLTPGFRGLASKTQSCCLVASSMNRCGGSTCREARKTGSEFTQAPKLEITGVFIQTFIRPLLPVVSSTKKKKALKFFILSPFALPSAKGSILLSLNVKLFQYFWPAKPCLLFLLKATLLRIVFFQHQYQAWFTDHPMNS